MNAATWYVMEDGTTADPAEVGPGEDGVLRHKDGRAVAYAPHGPRTRGVDPARERAKARAAEKAEAAGKAAEAAGKAEAEAAGRVEGRDMKPDAPARTYRTR